MEIADIKERGEYLGFCPAKGDLYSIPMGNDTYSIVAIKGEDVTNMMTFKVKQGKD